MVVNHSSMRLGKLPRRRDHRTLRLARYLGAEQAPPLQVPTRVDYTRGLAEWNLMLNDQLGCCTIAAVGHAVQVWTANSLGREVSVPDSTILDYYEKWDGYNPANAASDQGGVELDVLNDWRQQGFAGNTLDAFAAVDLNSGGSSPEIAEAIWLFGGAYIGLELPLSAQTQDVWDIDAQNSQDSAPGSWGGHAVYLVGYDLTTPALSAPPLLNKEGSSANPHPGAPNPESRIPNPGSLTCITWGQVKKMTWPWFQKYCSEAYALISKDWIESTGLAPSGFNLAALENDLKLVAA